MLEAAALDDEHFSKLQEVFAAVLELQGSEREARLEALCGGNAKLRGDVEQLLHDAEQPHELLATAEDAPPRRALPERIGDFEVLSVLGHGGMGVVYRAAQQEPRREVALKVLQPGYVHDLTLRRFAREAEVLGTLQHPGIAAVYDAGKFDYGFGELPWFAMELVEGSPLDRYAALHGADTSARVRLIIQACTAIQHAHERGVVHRDLKPGNVLVTEVSGEPVVKVLDFGIARCAALEPGITPWTLTGQVFGTLPYMSPEQVAGEVDRVDGRTDVYALGVMLYELLSGTLPVQTADLPMTEAARRIREVDPRPLKQLLDRVPPDLETVVGCALAKEPDRRYPTAEAFAADLARVLGTRPVQARPPSWGYRAKLLVRRHPGLALGVTLAITTLSVALAITWSLAASNRQLADREVAARQSLQSTLYSMQMSTAGDLIQAPLAAVQASALLDAWPTPQVNEPDLRGFEHRLLQAIVGSCTRRELGVPFYALHWLDPDRAVVITAQDVRLTSPDDLSDGQILLGPEDSRAGIVADGLENELIWSPEEGQLRIAPFEDMSRRRTVDIGSGFIEHITLDPSGSRLALTVDRTIVVLDRESGQHVTTLGSPEQRMGLEPSFSADGALLAVAPEDERLVRVYRCADWQVVAEIPTQQLPAYYLAFAPTGRRLAVALRTGGCRVHDLTSPADLDSNQRPRLLGNRSEGLPTVLRWSADGSRLAFATERGGLHVCDIDTGWQRPIQGHPRRTGAIALSPNGETLIGGDFSGSVSRWDLEGTAPQARIAIEPLEAGPMLRWQPDSRRLVVGRNHFGGRVVDATTGESTVPGGPGWFSADLDFVVRRPGDDYARRVFTEHIVVQRIADGSIIAEASGVGALPPRFDWSARGAELQVRREGTIRVLDARTGTWHSPPPGPPGSRLAETEDGKLQVRELKTRGMERLVVMEMDSHREIRVLPVNEHATSACFSPDGEQIAVGLASGPIVLIAWRSSTVLGQLTGQTEGVDSLHWHPTEPRLASSGVDGLCLWDVRTQLPVFTIKGWNGKARWSPDGATLAICVLGGPVHLLHAPRP